jgi:putative membrane protein
MKQIVRGAVLIALVGLLSCNENRKNENDNSKETAEKANDEKFKSNEANKDADFVAQAVGESYAEIKLAKLAEQRSASREVKEIARMVEKDHEKSLNELKTLAQHKAISLPVEENDQDKNDIEKFQDESGKDFDKKWCKEMIDAHEDAISKFENRMEKTEDADVKALANKTLPHLRTHLEKLNLCYTKLNKDNG